jgi:16S rRNA (uracil1498-N3)-methyltransferase
VNLLLIELAELREDSVFTISDRRAHHLRTVLGVQVGSTVRTGVIDKHIGTAEVLEITSDAITLRYDMVTLGPMPTPVDLVLAVPRPKVVTRTIEIAASFGVRRIDLTNAWRVDKSYLGSPRLAPDALALAARYGAEQGATIHIPPIRIHDRFMGMLDDRFVGIPVTMRHTVHPEPTLRLVAHPDAPPIEHVVTEQDLIALAIGPEGGWIERELATFVERGFKPVSLGRPILRVEAAVASALGQLLLVQRQLAARARS